MFVCFLLFLAKYIGNELLKLIDKASPKKRKFGLFQICASIKKLIPFCFQTFLIIFTSETSIRCMSYVSLVSTGVTSGDCNFQYSNMRSRVEGQRENMIFFGKT